MFCVKLAKVLELAAIGCQIHPERHSKKDQQTIHNPEELPIE